MGKVLIVVGMVILLTGIVIHFFDRIPLLGKLPGDILVKKENFTFYFPLASSVALSILVSLILYLIKKFS